MIPASKHRCHGDTIRDGHVDGVSNEESIVVELPQLETRDRNIGIVGFIVVYNTTADSKGIDIIKSTVNAPTDLEYSHSRLGGSVEVGGAVGYKHVSRAHPSNDASVVV